MALSTRISSSWVRRSRSAMAGAGPVTSVSIPTPRSAASAVAPRTVSVASAATSSATGDRVRLVSSQEASWRRSPTRPPRRSASPMMSATRALPSPVTRPSRSSTSALARIRAAGVRSSWDASATNRRWASKPSRIGTSARPVTRSVITAAATSPAAPDRQDRQHQAPGLLVVQRQDEASLHEADDRPVVGDGLRPQADVHARGLHRAHVHAAGSGRLDGRGVREPGERVPGPVADHGPARVQDEQDRVRATRRLVARTRHPPRRGARCRARPTWVPTAAASARSTSASRALRLDHRRRGAHAHDQHGQEAERHREQASPGAPEEAIGRADRHDGQSPALSV